MKNEELLCRHGSRLNPFTTALRDACLAHGKVLARMRDDNWREVVFVPAEEEHPWDDCPHGGFRSVDSCLYWMANGESITADRFDLVEFEPLAGIAPVPDAPDATTTVKNAASHIAKTWNEHIPRGFGVPFHHHLFIEAAIRQAGTDFLRTLKIS
ncbi:hypothetical protein DIE18_03940 [Burkholderia sp. Bp9125]|nr:hypothetical protein DIE18_03940 [Burkholderia sp. Bp9125]